MTLDHDEGRPRARGGPVDEKPGGRVVTDMVRGDQADRLYALGLAAAELVDDLVSQHRREDDAFALGYRLGFTAGSEVGYQRVENEMAGAWSVLAAKVRSMASVPTVDELERRRWGGRREDFGRPRPGDYPGGPASVEAWERWAVQRGKRRAA